MNGHCLAEPAMRALCRDKRARSTIVRDLIGVR